MAGQPWFKKWAGDYLSDSKIRLLTYEQRGILETLWAFAWQDGGIPARVEEQAILLGIPAKAMRTHSVWIAKFFVSHPTDAERMVSPRMELERQEAEEKSGKARESAQARWAKRIANGDANASNPHPDPHTQTQCEPDAFRMLSVSVSETESEKNNPPTPLGGAVGSPVEAKPARKRTLKAEKLQGFQPEVVSLVRRLMAVWPTMRDGKPFRSDDVAAAAAIERILADHPDVTLYELETAAVSWIQTAPAFPNALEFWFGRGKPGVMPPWEREVRGLRTRQVSA